MKKDYIITFATEFFILASGVVVYKLAAVYLGKEGFSEYALSMKTIALIQPILLIGLSVGIPKYIAYSQGSDYKKGSDNYFIGGLASVFSLLAVFLFALNIFKYSFAFLLFGDNQHVDLILPLSFLLVGICFHVICYSYFRGHIKMTSANLLRLFHSFVPLITIIYFGNQVSSILTMIGIIWIVISIVSLFFIVPNIIFHKPLLYEQTRELLKYGIRRLPADIGLSSILILPATITAHIAGIKEAGFIAFGISVLSMSTAIFAPIGLILLPKVSGAIGQNSIGSLTKHIKSILIGTVISAALMVVIFILFAEIIIKLYLGREFLEIVKILKIVSIGIIPFAVYVSMRSVIDGYYKKAVNTKNVLIALITFLLCTTVPLSITKDYLHILLSLVIGLFVLGMLTMFEIKSLLRFNQK